MEIFAGSVGLALNSKSIVLIWGFVVQMRPTKTAEGLSTKTGIVASDYYHA